MLLEKAGVTEEEQAQLVRAAVDTTKRLLTAEKVQYFAHEGVVTDERRVADHATQARAVELVHDFLGTNAARQRTVVVEHHVELPEWAKPQVIDAPQDAIDVDAEPAQIEAPQGAHEPGASVVGPGGRD